MKPEKKLHKKKMRVRKYIKQRDKNFHFEGLIELRNTFNKRERNSKMRVKMKTKIKQLTER